MAGNVDYGCTNAMCVADLYRSKYKVIRAAFVAMGQINRRKMKEILKVRQRVFQLCQDGLVLAKQPHDADIAEKFEKIKAQLADDCLIP